MVFEVKGKPRGKQRPKFSRHGDKVRTYTPAETVNYEQWVRLCYQQAGGVHFGSEPIAIHLNVGYQVPKSFSRKKRERAIQGLIVPTSKPDCDNVLKIICDSLNGIAYDDDKQVVYAVVNKCYASEPKVFVSINKIDQVPR